MYIQARIRAYPCSEDGRTEPGVQSESRPEHSVFEQLFRMKLEQRCRAPQRGRPSRPEQRFRPPQRSRASSSGHFERPSEAERIRAANVSASAKPSGPEQRFRQPRRSRAGSCGPARPRELERPFRAPSGCGAVDSGVFEARQAIRSSDNVLSPFSDNRKFK